MNYIYNDLIQKYKNETDILIIDIWDIYYNNIIKYSDIIFYNVLFGKFEEDVSYTNDINFITLIRDIISEKILVDIMEK